MFRLQVYVFVFLLICNVFNCNESKILKPMTNGKSPLVIGEGDWNSTKDCERCHQTITQNHQKSAHANSWTDPIFVKAFQKEPKQWCMNCHAPLHSFASNVDFKSIAQYQSKNDLWMEGVNCAVCHVRENIIYGKQTRTDIKDHIVIEDQSFKNNSLCQNCHSFPFPKQHFPKIEYTDVIMQGTGTEAQGLISDISKSNLCVNCHLKTNHQLNGTVFDSNWMEDWKVSVESIQKEKTYFVNLKMKFPKMGHKFPTGDLFRSLVFRIYDRSQRLLFEYRFEKKMRLKDLVEVRDTRLSPDSTTEFEDTFSIIEPPYECELVYHLQFSIENELKDHFSNAELLRPIFRDKCTIK
ncbi:cytochrome c554 and C-prime [Leptospira kemamanensis]|uniref:Cytochrome c554 and C-prime n=1 Tax=Leptospira kemamanensis TaxID=2484942 RepID=A0A4R9JUH8_9LEPT|nr:multiheme c-type cytochrome [Leptospira kemamanensis]TGL55910.1 cytochrome c554 and C-prime [Leptospira kemamanensis]